jgi:hypothetical protein
LLLPAIYDLNQYLAMKMLKRKHGLEQEVSRFPDLEYKLFLYAKLNPMNMKLKGRHLSGRPRSR